MGDLIRGETFAQNQRVTAARLHALVEGATIRPTTVTASKMADQCVETRHLAPTLVIPTSYTALSEGSLMVGGSTNKGRDTTFNDAQFEVNDTSQEFQIKAGGLTGTEYGDRSIAAAKLDSKAVLFAAATGSANSYAATVTGLTYGDGTATSNLLALKVNATNTGASTLAINSDPAKAIVDSEGNAVRYGMLVAGTVVLLVYNGTAWQLASWVLPRSQTFTGALPAAGTPDSLSNVYGVAPDSWDLYLVNATPQHGYTTGDMVSASAAWVYFSAGPYPFLWVSITASGTIKVHRSNVANVYIGDGATGAPSALLTPANWTYKLICTWR